MTTPRPNRMKFGSLFTGIGGLDIALESCDLAPIWQVEVDSFCNSVLERHWPDVQRYTDIRRIDWASVERPHILCGGFPCQPFSVAGQNRGADDERNLWPETYRAVRELRPRYVFLENVPGLLAHGYFGTILGDLAQGGYDAVWDTFTAAEVGASHRRERLFILAYARQQPERLRRRGLCAEPPSAINEVAHADEGRHGEQAEAVRAGRAAHLNGDGDVGHAKGERRASGAKPTVRGRQASVGLTGASTADAAGSRQRTGLRDNDAGQSDAVRGCTMAVSERWGLKAIGRLYLAHQYAASTGAFPPGPDDRDAWARVLAEVPSLEPAVCRVVARVSDRTHRLRALGNAVVPAQGAYAFRKLWQRMSV